MLRGNTVGGHTKNLFLRDKKGALFLVVAPEDAAHRPQGAASAAWRLRRLSFGSSELMRELLGSGQVR